MGMNSLILDAHSHDLPADIQEQLAISIASSKVLLTLINNLLDIRKFDFNGLDELELRPISVAPQLSTSVEFCQSLAAVSSITPELDFERSSFGPSEHATAMSDKMCLQRLFINLISNAIQYSPAGSVVKVSLNIVSRKTVAGSIARSMVSGNNQSRRAKLEVDGASNNSRTSKVLVISILDQGNGINEKEKMRMFKNISRLNASTQRTVRSADVEQPTNPGLGLNLCAKLVHHMNGEIWATNNELNSNNNGRDRCGACFSFFLPLFDDAGDVSSMENNGERPPPLTITSSSVFPDYTGLLLSRSNSIAELQVLVVDDITINLKIVEKLLKRIGVGSIRLAKSGEQALEILAKENFDLVISDLQMPGGMSGTELCEQIIKSELTQKPVVVGLTAEVAVDLDRRCAASGMVFVLHKPIELIVLKSFLNVLFTPTSIELVS